MSSLFQDILKRTPLRTRIKVPLEMAHLNLMIVPDRCCTDEEADAACKWAGEMTDRILEAIEEWERDGRPAPLPKDD